MHSAILNWQPSGRLIPVRGSRSSMRWMSVRKSRVRVLDAASAPGIYDLQPDDSENTDAGEEDAERPRPAACKAAAREGMERARGKHGSERLHRQLRHTCARAALTGLAFSHLEGRAGLQAAAMLYLREGRET